MLTNTDNAEFIPAPCTDLGEAGSIWRTDRLSEYRFQLKQLGLEDDPAFASLLNQIEQHTDELEKLWENQKQPEYQQPWWQDGEYDEERADQANEAGSQLFSKGNYSDAFDAFTEAIRLNPKSPVYFSNRAAVALKLKRPAIAAEDAQHALKRDAVYIKAALRGGKAYLQIKQPVQAIEMYKKVIDIDQQNKAALKGLEEAKCMEKQQKQQGEEDRKAAMAGSRPAMPRTPVPRDDAVLQLLTATDMLKANPRLEAAKAAQVEALLLCGRYADALSACETLQPGAADTQYLMAEILWRRGDIDSASVQLNKLKINGTDKLPAAAAEKCVSLLAFLRQLQQLEAAVEEGWEVGQYSQCIEACDAMLECVDSMDQVATGLYCKILTKRGEAYAARQMWEESLTDLNAALAADSLQANCLKTRAKVLQLMGRPTEAFLDLQKLKKVHPTMPGLSKLVEQAAQLCLGEASGDTNDTSSSSSTKPAPGLMRGGTAVDHACRVLGLEHQAHSSSPSSSVITVSAVRKAYLSLASKWHPDKWTNARKEEKLHAEATFKEIQKAYELLTTAI